MTAILPGGYASPPPGPEASVRRRTAQLATLDWHVPLALDVLFPLPLGRMSYLPPLAGDDPEVGVRVVVPWQAGLRIGVVAGRRQVEAGRGMELRHALHALDRGTWLRPEAFAATLRLARAYGVPEGAVLAAASPPGLHPDLEHRVRVHPEAAEMVRDAAPDAPLDRWGDAATLSATLLELLRRQGLVDERARPIVPTRRVLVPARQPDDDLRGACREAQRAALEHLLAVERADSAAALARDADVPVTAVRALIARGYAAYAEVEVEAPPLPSPPSPPEPPGGAAPSLEPPASAVPPEGHGAVVGGTRHERLAALVPRIRADQAAGRSVLVLAPEQAIAAEAAAELAGSLPVRWLTGAASDAQRERAWQELADPPASVVVGTSLALFAPLPALGRVVVLEAGNAAYKLPAGARLWLPRAAHELARASGAALTVTDVLAGPEVAASVTASARRALPLPRLRLHVADLQSSPNWPLHPDLLATLRQVQERGRQAVVLAPRRGFSGALGCPDCGWNAPCPNCDLPLRFHQQEARLRCHQCGHDEPVPPLCPACGGAGLGPVKGAGTQWVASQLATMLPGFAVLRYDRDRRDDVGPLLEGAPGVVVGTTAILGLPALPNLSLVGITHFDTHLASTDYRADEEAARILLRLAELFGSRRPLVVVQTHAPHAEVLQALSAADPDLALEAFLGRQLERRKRFGYPPFARLAKVQFSARDRSSAWAAAEAAVDTLREAGAHEDEVLGPVAAPVARVRNRYVVQVLLRSGDEVRLEGLLGALPTRLTKARVILDVDPRDVGALLD